MADAFAEPSDLEARWRPLTDTDSQVAITRLLDASMIIRERWPDVDARILSGSLAAATLTRIVCEMVKRSMSAGDLTGVESVTQAAGPFNFGTKYANPSGDLYLNAAEIRVLDGEGFGTRVRQGWAI